MEKCKSVTQLPECALLRPVGECNSFKLAINVCLV